MTQRQIVGSTLVLIVASVGLAVGIRMEYQRQRRINEAQSRPPLQGLVKASEYQVELANIGERTWTAVRVLVNGSYRCPEVAEIRRGAAVTIRLAECVTANGGRFSPAAMKAINVYVDAEVSADGTRQNRSYALP